MDSPPLNPGDGRTAVLHGHLRAGPFLLTCKTYHAGFERAGHEHPVAAIDFVLAGLGRTRYRRQSVEHGAGNLEFCPAGVDHAHDSGGRSMRCVHVSFWPGAAREAGARLPSTPTLAHSPAGVGLGLRLLRALRESDASSVLSAESTAFELLEAIGGADGPTSTDERLDPAIDMLHATLDAPIGLEALADACGLSRGRFAVVFKASLGCAAGQYHRRLRVMEAVRLLTRTREPISIVASRTGFADQAHLTRTLSAECGVTPARLREEMGRSLGD